MLRKIATVFVVILLLPVFASAQEYNVLKPDGKIYKYKGDLKNLEVRKTRGIKSGINKSILKNYINVNNSNLNVIDTMSYPGPYGAQFGFYGQDWMVMWFEAPADLNLLKVGFATYGNDDAQTVEVKVVSFNWTKEEIYAAGVNNIGYYEALGNGYNDITAFLDNPDITGGWTARPGFSTEIFGNDIWSDEGSGYPIIPVGNTSEPTYQWVDLSMLPPVPQLTIGELFGIAIKHTGVDMDQNYLGMWYSSDAGVPLLKFYANGRSISPPDPNSDEGWWSRTGYSLLYAAVVELTGDRAPKILSYTHIPSGIDTGPYTVDAEIVDDNPGDPTNAGVASATIKYSIDGGTTYFDAPMTGTEPNFSGQIPVQLPETTVEYYIEAVDVNSNDSQSSNSVFYVFEPSGASTLVIYNGFGFDKTEGYPQDYFWGPNIAPGGMSTFEHDRWAYGLVDYNMLDNYNDIIEICSGAPAAYNDSLIALWLAGDKNRNYLLAGQEWLGARYGYEDQDFQPGDFEYDILGIDSSFNDISYVNDSLDYAILPTLVTPQAGSMFGQPLVDLFNSLDPPADSMMYNPVSQIFSQNWQDGYTVVPGMDVEVDMMVETRGIAYEPMVRTLPTASHRTLPAGNKIVFLAYDPIALTTAVDSTYPYFHWVGYDEANTPYQALLWFDVAVGVEKEDNLIPEEFSISQNYPNPFNPSTSITFSVPKTLNVVLKVYDVLGREVAALVNEKVEAGNYTVNFDASKLASGIYIYSFNAGEFNVSKKMILLK